MKMLTRRFVLLLQIIAVTNLFFILESCSSHSTEDRSSVIQSDTIPIKLNPHGIYVQGILFGDTVWFLFDTGASENVIPRIENEKSFIKKATVYDAVGGKKELGLYSVEIRIGAFIDQSEAMLLDNHRPILGLSTILRHTWDFDFENKVVIMSNQAYDLKEPTLNTTILHFSRNKISKLISNLSIPICTDSVKKKILIDTGTPIILDLNRDFFSTAPDFIINRRESSGAFSSSFRCDTVRSYFKDICIGMEKFDRILVTENSMGHGADEGLIGFPLFTSFKHFVICPFSSRLILRDRYRSPLSPEMLTYMNVNMNQWGIQGSKNRVVSIISGSDFDRKDVSIGDVIEKTQIVKDSIFCTIVHNGQKKLVKGHHFFSFEQKLQYYPYIISNGGYFSNNTLIEDISDICDSIIFDSTSGLYKHYLSSPFRNDHPLQEDVCVEMFDN